MKLKDILLPITEEAEKAGKPEKTENTPAFTSAVLKKSNQYKKALEDIDAATSVEMARKIAKKALK